MMSARILAIARAEMGRLSQHSVTYFDWKKRREIYKLLNLDSTTTSNPRHKFLAIQSAEFVLPLYQSIYPEDSLVFELFNCAKAFAENRVAGIDKLDAIEDAGYHASQWFGYNFEKEQVDYQSAHAGFAAYKALVEVRRMLDPWEGVSFLSKEQDMIQLGSVQDKEWMRGDDFTDEDWSRLAAFGDTAAAASFAYSTSRFSNQCHPKLLYDFWKWWTEVALPKALLY